MPSINKLRASDGSGNAQIATVQSTRAALSSTIEVDTVAGIPANFMASMGTPHTFTDPITSEEITVISEATAVDFSGHVDGANLEIDDIAPGYVDGGSAIGDIIIIRPTTQWGDELADVLDVAHNDDGTLKDDIVDADNIAAGALVAAYPVGSIYMNAAVSTNPATLLGFGTWSAFGAGKVLVGLDSGDASFDTLEETGGSKTHDHSVNAQSTSSGSHTHEGNSQSLARSINSSADPIDSASSLQPYIVVYMWKRTA